jgi:hypothetical protein
MRHQINAFYNTNLVATFFRNSSDLNVDVIYKILNLDKYYDCELGSENKIKIGRKELQDALSLLEHHQYLKEIDFLKPCLYYLRDSSEKEKIELVFTKTKLQ